MNDSKTDYVLKILTIGESGVGKTCILLRYTDNRFIKNHLTTIGNINFHLKKESITNRKTSLLQTKQLNSKSGTQPGRKDSATLLNSTIKMLTE